MGVWGYGAFQNDDSLNWIEGLQDSTDLAYIEAAFDKVLSDTTSYLEAPEACEAIAAAETLAHLLGNIDSTSPAASPIDDWVNKVKILPKQTIIEKAKSALKRLQEEPSELLELWEESTEMAQWLRSLSELSLRLESK
jgi:hypothetical protein